LKGKIIVFAPHPDDETFGCGGTIAKRISEGYDVLIVVMTDGRYSFLKVLGIDSDPTPEELKEIRKEEVKRATRILGVPEENLIFVDFIDDTLEDNEKEAENKVFGILSENRPTEVFLPYKRDGHPDHRVTYRIVKSSIKKLGTPAKMYQYSILHKYAQFGPIIDALLNLLRYNSIVYEDITQFLSIKEAAIKQFESELRVISSKQQIPITDTKSIRKFLKNKELFYIDR